MTENECLNIENLKKRAACHGKANNIRRARRILRILRRDNFKCTKCSTTEKLTIHHLNGRAFAKSDNAQKYRIKECITLCVDCHTKEHEDVQ